MVVAALLHDIGDEFAPMNHSQYAAAVLRPYVSEKTHWIVEKHGLFQTYYSAEHLGGDKNARETYKDDDDLGAIIKDKQTLLNAITAAIGPSGKLSVQEWASIGKALGIYTDKI